MAQGCGDAVEGCKVVFFFVFSRAEDGCDDVFFCVLPGDAIMVGGCGAAIGETG